MTRADLVRELLQAIDELLAMARERDGLREALHVAVAELRDSTLGNKRLTEQNRALALENKRLRESILRDELRAA